MCSGNRWYDDEKWINAEANVFENNLSDAKISLKALLDERDTEAAAKVEQMGKEGAEFTLTGVCDKLVKRLKFSLAQKIKHDYKDGMTKIPEKRSYK